MFDFDYNESIGFVPMVTRIGRGPASEEEVKKISKTVSEQSAAVAENSAAISENTAAIAENADAIVENAEAIADETAAREAAVEELNEKIDAIQSFKMEVVDELPATGEAGTIYLVKDAGKDTYTEYVYANGAWEKLGSEVDLSDYAKTTDLEALEDRVSDLEDNPGSGGEGGDFPYAAELRQEHRRPRLSALSCVPSTYRNH